MRYLRLKILALIWLVCASVTVPLAAQNLPASPSEDDQPQPPTSTEPTDDVQWWPDMQLNWRVRPALSLVLFGTIRRGQVNDDAVAKQLGVGFNWAIKKQLNLASQYRHVISTPTPARRTVEERFHIDFTPRTPLRAGFSLSDRTRVEWRSLNGAFAMRYRNRVQVERPLNWTFNGHEHRLIPYFSYELFYDTRVHAFSRQQIFAGSRVPIVNHVTFNGFYMRQLDSRSRPGYIHVVGSFLQFDF